MMHFIQKDSLVTNFNNSKRDLYEKAMEIFVSYNPKIKVWIEPTAFDSLGRKMDEDLSLHSDGGFKGKLKWMRFFKKINKKKLMAGEIKPKQNLAEKIKAFLF
jgi:hypothetical protein